MSGRVISIPRVTKPRIRIVVGSPSTPVDSVEARWVGRTGDPCARTYTGSPRLSAPQIAWILRDIITTVQRERAT